MPNTYQRKPSPTEPGDTAARVDGRKLKRVESPFPLGEFNLFTEGGAQRLAALIISYWRQRGFVIRYVDAPTRERACIWVERGEYNMGFRAAPFLVRSSFRNGWPG